MKRVLIEEMKEEITKVVNQDKYIGRMYMQEACLALMELATGQMIFICEHGRGEGDENA